MFRKWSAITAIAGALERRVWIETAQSVVFPNLFVLLVAPPGVGKTQAISRVQYLWDKTRKLKVAPDDVTKASLIDHLAEAKQVHVYSAQDMVEYHSLAIAADEFGVLCSSHDLNFMSVMNALYDNRAKYKESRRGRDGDLDIVNPQVNLLAGTQPDFMASLLPPEAWGMGFMSRIIMIYQGKKVKPKLFGAKTKLHMGDLEADLKSVCELHGEMVFTPEAEARLVQWYDGGELPMPEHSKLKHYVPRRILNVLKLAMVSCAARGNEMSIEPDDVTRAIDWLVEAEALMPDVFKDMGGNSDGLIIQDLHHYVWELYTKGNQKPVHRARIDTFLMARTPAYNAENIVRLATSAGILVSAGENLFTPGSKNNLRTE